MDFVREHGLREDPWFYRLPEPPSGGVHAPGYDMPHFNQVLWYWNRSTALEREQGAKVPGLMVMHQPVPEYTIPYKNPAQTFYRGNMREQVGTGNYNGGLFGAVVDRGESLRKNADAGDTDAVILLVERESDVGHSQKIVGERFFLLRYPF